MSGNDGCLYFLKIEGIEGDSCWVSHKGEIQLDGFSWGQDSSGGKIQMQNFQFVAPVSKATPGLLAACATGQHFNEAVLTCLRPLNERGWTVLRFILHFCLVAWHQIEASDFGMPRDRVSLNFGRVEWEYTGMELDGSASEPIKGGWDLVADQPV